MAAAWGCVEHARIAMLEFQRPPRNFMSFAALGELGDALDALRDREDITLVMLASATPGYYIAHADLEDLGRAIRGEPPIGDRDAWALTLRKIEHQPQPVVAAISGQCWGGGMELSLACTLRIAAEDATFALPEVAAGIVPGAGGTQRLVRLIGQGRALEMMLSSRVIDAREALGLTIVEAVLPAVSFREAALAWCGRLARHSRRALVDTKRVALHGGRMPFDEGLAYERESAIPILTDPAFLAMRETMVARYAEAPASTTVYFTRSGQEST